MEAVFNYACGRMTPEASLLTQLKPSLTDSELEILSLPQDDAVEKFSYNIGWKLENMWPLAWVLGWEKQPDVDGNMIDDDTIEAMLTDFMTRQPQLKLRSIDEVAALEDLFYCAHNAAVSARLGQDTAPESFHPIMNGGVIHERRHALTWCLSDCAWDDTDLNT